MSKKIENLINQINDLNNIELNNIKKDVNYIIQNKVKDIFVIESIFDRMLSLTFIDDTILRSIYFRFLNYYKNINFECANEYEKFFIEQYGREKVKKYE